MPHASENGRTRKKKKKKKADFRFFVYIYVIFASHRTNVCVSLIQQSILTTNFIALLPI